MVIPGYICCWLKGSNQSSQASFLMDFLTKLTFVTTQSWQERELNSVMRL